MVVCRVMQGCVPLYSSEAKLAFDLQEHLFRFIDDFATIKTIFFKRGMRG